MSGAPGQTSHRDTAFSPRRSYRPVQDRGRRSKMLRGNTQRPRRLRSFPAATVSVLNALASRHFLSPRRKSKSARSKPQPAKMKVPN